MWEWYRLVTIHNTKQMSVEIVLIDVFIESSTDTEL